MKKWLFSISLLLVLSSVMFVSAGFFDFFKSDGGITGKVIDIQSDLSEVAKFGSEVVVNDTWKQIRFDTDFGIDDEVVVIATMVTKNGDDPSHVRIKDVREDGFKMKIEEWDYLDGGHLNEEVSWIAIPKGTYNWNGKKIIVESISGVKESFVSVDGVFFANAVVLTQIQSYDTSSDNLVTRTSEVSGTSFKIRTQKEKNKVNDAYGGAKIGYIVAEKGFYNTGTDMVLETGIFTDMTHVEQTKNFRFSGDDTDQRFFLGNLVTPKWDASEFIDSYSHGPHHASWFKCKLFADCPSSTIYPSSDKYHVFYTNPNGYLYSHLEVISGTPSGVHTHSTPIHPYTSLVETAAASLIILGKTMWLFL